MERREEVGLLSAFRQCLGRAGMVHVHARAIGNLAIIVHFRLSNIYIPDTSRTSSPTSPHIKALCI